MIIKAEGLKGNNIEKRPGDKAGLFLKSGIERAIGKRDGLIDKDLSSDKRARGFTIFNDLPNTFVDGQSKVLTENFNSSLNSLELINSDGKLSDNDSFNKLMALAENKKLKPEIKVKYTDGVDKKGIPFNNVTVTVGEESLDFQVRDSQNNHIRTQMINNMLSSKDPSVVLKGEIFKSKIDHGAAIADSNFGGQDDGVIALNDGESTYDVYYRRDSTDSYYDVFMMDNGEEVSIAKNDDKKIYGKDELALALNNAKVNIQAAKQNAIQSKNKPKDVKMVPKENALEKEIGEPMSRLIDFTSSTESSADPNSIYSGYEGDTSGVDLSNMSIDDVMSFQKKMINEGSKSTAVGAHQMLMKVIAEESKKMGIDTRSVKFNKETQDKIMSNRIARMRGFKSFMGSNTEKSLNDFALNLSKEFASFPNPYTNRSFYDGDGLNKSLIRIEEVKEFLRNLRA